MDGVAQIESEGDRRHASVGMHIESHKVSTSVPLPERGAEFTEEQICERFGVKKYGGIRVNQASKIIVVVNRVDGVTQYRNVEHGKHLDFSGHDVDYQGRMQSDDVALANSLKEGYAVLYFVKKHGRLLFEGRVECTSHRPPSGASPGQKVSFRLRRIKDVRGTPTPYSDASLANIEMVEESLLSARKFETRRDLIESLPKEVSPESLDRILDYLVRSGKVSTDDESIRWIFCDQQSTMKDVEDIESYIETFDILADPDSAEQIRRSREDLRAGRVVPWVKGRAQNTR